MASREELMNSIQPGMRLDRNFFLKVYGYELTYPGFAELALAKLEQAGCSLARGYYDGVVGEWRYYHEKVMNNVAEWYRNQDFSRKVVRESRKKQEAERRTRDDLQQKSDKELLTLLQKLRVEKRL